MRGMDLEAVHACLAQMRDRLAVDLAHPPDLVLAHFVGGNGSVGHPKLRCRRAKGWRRRTQRLPMAIHAPPIPELAEEPAAGRMQCLGHRPEGRDVLLQKRRRLEGAAALVDGHAGDYQPASAILYPLDIVSDEILARCRTDAERNAMRREIEAVRYFDRPKPDRLENVGIRRVCRNHAALSSRGPSYLYRERAHNHVRGWMPVSRPAIDRPRRPSRRTGDPSL